MNKRQHKKVHCTVTVSGDTIYSNRVVPCAYRKETKRWFKSVAANKGALKLIRGEEIVPPNIFDIAREVAIERWERK